MNHFADPAFWKAYEKLPKRVQKQADKNFDLLKADSKHPSLHFKQVGKYWSVRVNDDVRALAVSAEGDFIWFWIGSHAAYDKLLAR